MLAARDVTVAVDAAVLLRGVSAHVAPGEVSVLLGENGAGKSTLLRVLAGDVAPRSGEVTLDGHPMRTLGIAQRARARAVLPQAASFAFGFTALETVLIGRYPHARSSTRSRDLEIARAALAALDAAHLEARLVTTLSGGEAARVQFARALAQLWPGEGGDPRYLLLDEPTASLDPAHQHLALRTARTLARDHGVGVLAVLHDVNLAAQYADRVVLLKDGAAIAQGTPADAFTPASLAACFRVEATVLPHPRSDRPLIVMSA
jgi:iron complex transport system ATP-binding protein